MIFGIGTDLVLCSRIERGYNRFQERFVQHLLAPDEMNEFLSQNHPISFLAKRFAAKEAFSKAVHTGLLHPVSLSNISIQHDHLGQPFFHFAPPLAEWLAMRGITQTHLSLTDQGDFVVAFVVVES